MKNVEPRSVTPASHTSSRAVLWLVLAVLGWSGNHIVGRAARADIGPVELNFWRWSLASIVLLVLARSEFPRMRKQLREGWPYVLLLGVTGVAGFNTLLYVGLSKTTAVNAAWVLSTTPIFIVLVSWIVRADRLSPLQGLGVVASGLGVAIVISHGRLSTLTQLEINRGDLWVLLSVPFWSVYSVALRKRPPDLSAIAITAMTAVSGTLVIAPFYAWELSSRGAMNWGLNSALFITYVGLVASVIAFLAWGAGLARIGPNRAGLFLHLMPMFTSVLAVVFLGEPMLSSTYLGAVFILAGLVLVTKRSPPKTS